MTAAEVEWSLDYYAGCGLSYPEIWARVDLDPAGDRWRGWPRNIKTPALVPKYRLRLDGSRIGAGEGPLYGWWHRVG